MIERKESRLPLLANRKWNCGALCLLVALLSSGCSQMTSSWNIKDWKSPNLVAEKKAEAELPGRVMAIWTDAIHHKQGESATRGFGGRIVFYNEAKSEPIQVEGTLTVYAFLDNEGNQSTKPEKKFVIHPEQLAQHFSRCSLGDSYSIWLPWDAVGGPSQQISLITRFDGINGGTVLSEPARKLLPGRSNSHQLSQQDEVDRQPNGFDNNSFQSNSVGRQPVKNLFYDEATDSPQNVSLASFVANEVPANRTPTNRSTVNSTQRVQTVDLGAASQNANSQTMQIPTALGMRNFGATSAVKTDVHSARNSDAVEPKVLDDLQVQSEARVEQQAGATVFYGRPGQTLAERQMVMNQAKGGDERFQNYQADSLRLRQDQLQQVKDSRQQFRSEPWRFPVRTQSITRPTGVVAD